MIPFPGNFEGLSHVPVALLHFGQRFTSSRLGQGSISGFHRGTLFHAKLFAHTRGTRRDQEWIENASRTRLLLPNCWSLVHGVARPLLYTLPSASQLSQAFAVHVFISIALAQNRLNNLPVPTGQLA